MSREIGNSIKKIVSKGKAVLQSVKSTASKNPQRASVYQAPVNSSTRYSSTGAPMSVPSKVKATNQSFPSNTPKANMTYANAPKFTPAGGVGVKSGGFTYTPSGWVSSKAPTVGAGPKVSTSSGGGRGQVLGASTNSISTNGSLNPDMTGTSDSYGSSNISSPAGQTGLGYNVSSVPTSSVSTMNPLNANEMKPVPGITLPEKQITVAPTVAPVVTPETQPQEKDALTSYLEGLNEIERPSSADAYLKAQRETGILQKQQAVNDLSSQLNAIVNKGQASQLSLVGQGRGIPEAIIGGQQAQIGRETAIAALPVQAQLQAAQGNLEMANDNLDTLFKMYSDDAKNEYEYRREVKKAIYEHASAKEKRALEKADKLEERAYQETKDLYKEQNDYAKMAFANNQSSLGAKIAKLDYKSKTFKQDLAKLTSQINDPSKELDIQIKREDLKKKISENINSGSNGEVNRKIALTATKIQDMLTNGIGTAAVGKSAIFSTSRIPGTEAANFRINTDTLKSLLTLDNLKYLKGPTSDKDIAFLMAAGTTLSRSQSETEFSNTLNGIISTYSKYVPELQYVNEVSGIVKNPTLNLQTNANAYANQVLYN